jgi:hypothetical protein
LTLGIGGGGRLPIASGPARLGTGGRPRFGGGGGSWRGAVDLALGGSGAAARALGGSGGGMDRFGGDGGVVGLFRTGGGGGPDRMLRGLSSSSHAFAGELVSRFPVMALLHKPNRYPTQIAHAPNERKSRLFLRQLADTPQFSLSGR